MSMTRLSFKLTNTELLCTQPLIFTDNLEEMQMSFTKKKNSLTELAFILKVDLTSFMKHEVYFSFIS